VPLGQLSLSQAAAEIAPVVAIQPLLDGFKNARISKRRCRIGHLFTPKGLSVALATFKSMASVDSGDTSSYTAGDPNSAAILAAAKAEVELMMQNIAAQSQGPALFSTTLSEACRGQHLSDFVRILVEMGGIGPALCEMQSAQSLNYTAPYAAPVDMSMMQGFNRMAPVDFQSLQGFPQMAPLGMLGYNPMASQFGSYPFVQPSCQTPRSREDLSFAKSVDLELVGTTLVAKTANDQAKLDVRSWLPHISSRYNNAVLLLKV
jgi:hypothetical protein